MAKNKKEEKKVEDGVKVFNTSDEEKVNIRRILSTVGFFNTAIEGMQFSLEVEQRKIEMRCNVGKAREGYRIITRLDPETLNLYVKEVKIEPEQDLTKN